MCVCVCIYINIYGERADGEERGGGVVPFPIVSLTCKVLEAKDIVFKECT